VSIALLPVHNTVQRAYSKLSICTSIPIFNTYTPYLPIARIMYIAIPNVNVHAATQHPFGFFWGKISTYILVFMLSIYDKGMHPRVVTQQSLSRATSFTYCTLHRYVLCPSLVTRPTSATALLPFADSTPCSLP